MQRPPLTPPEQITNLLNGSWAIQILKSATELEIFETLKDEAKTADQVAGALKYPLKGVALLLDSLVGMGFLQRLDLANPGKFNAPTFALAEGTGEYLLKESPLYMGMYLKQHTELDKMWRGLKDTVQTGKPVMEVNQDAKAEEVFPNLAESIIPLNYAIALDALNVVKARLGDGPFKVLDVAAGSAVWSIPFAQDHAKTMVSALDFPAVLAVMERITKRFEVEKQFSNLPGNWREVKVEPASFDVIILGHILHSEGLELSRQLLKYCAQALRPGGILVIAEFFTNREKTAPLHPLMFGLNMYLATTDGCVFSREEMTALCTEAGFSSVVKHSSSDYVSPLLFAIK